MQTMNWLVRQTPRLPVLSIKYQHLDPWNEVERALLDHERAQMEFGPFKFEPPAVATHKKNKKGSDGFRIISVPNASMRVVHHALETHVRTAMSAHLKGSRFVFAECKRTLASWQSLPSAYAYKRGTSAARTVEKHSEMVGEKVWSIDLKDAFGSVGMQSLATAITGILLADTSPVLGRFTPKQEVLYVEADDLFPERVQMTLFRRVYALLLEFFAADKANAKGLYQGSPVSPWLFNLYCEALINPAIRVALHGARQASYGMGDVVFTQFADNIDIAVTGPIRLPKRIILRAIENVFRINHGKTFYQILARGRSPMLGYSIDDGGRIVYPQVKRERLHVAIELAVKAFRRGGRAKGRELYQKAMGLHSEFVEYLRVLDRTGLKKTQSDERTLDRVDALKAWKP